MDLSKHLEKAEEAIRRKNFDGAIGLFEELLKIKPDEYRARKGLLEAARRKFEYKRPMKALIMASAGSSLATAKTMATMKKWARAAESYQKAVVADPTNLGWCQSLGECFERGAMHQSGLAVYEHMAEVDGKNIEALKRAGALCYGRKDFQKALDYYERALEINPRDHDALKARKNLAAEGILKEKGFETAGSSRDLIKDKEEQRRLEKSQRLHRTEEEIQTEVDRLEKHLAENPKDTAALEELGGYFEKRRDWDRAKECYQRALDADPGQDGIRAKMDQVILKRYDHRIDEARKGSDEAKVRELEGQKLGFESRRLGERVEAHPTDLGLRYRYGRNLFRLGKVDQAIAELQKAMADPRWKMDGAVVLGQCFFKKGLFDLAQKQLEKALELAPSGSEKAKEILYNLGLVAERMSAPEAASAYYSRIYEIDIGYRDVAQKVEQLRDMTKGSD